MKKIYIFILGVLLSANSFAQGTIQSFVLDPPSPSTADFVKVYTTVMFSSGGCAVSSQGSSTTGSVSNGYALHCLGMLSVICSKVDTFSLGYLPAGPHVFKFTLSSGMGGPPCSPGFVPDDRDSINFAVTTTTGISDIHQKDAFVTIYPNPMHSTATIKIDPLLRLQSAEIKIMDMMGKTVKIISAIQSNEIVLNRDELPAGIYFYQLYETKETISIGKFIIE